MSRLSMSLGGTPALGWNTMVLHHWLCGLDTSWITECKLMQILSLRKEYKPVWMHAGADVSRSTTVHVSTCHCL